MRTCVQAYVVGKLQFASSLYWLRATKASIRRARFDYCMALASVVGCNAAEIVGLLNCKTRGVSENCKNYKELCKFLDLPMLRTMVIKDARSMIRQWFLFDSSRFNSRKAPEGPCPDGAIAVVRDKVKMLIESVSGDKSTLLGDLFKLATSELVRPYAEYHRRKDQGTLLDLSAEELDELKPEWMQSIDLARSQTEKLRNELNLSSPSETDVMNTFWLMAKGRFKVLERYHRVVKHLEVTPVPPARTQGVCRQHPDNAELEPDLDQSDSKRQKIEHLSCSSKTPFRRLRSNPKLTCWICGYGITQKKCVEFKCCDNQKVAHNVCWRNQTSRTTDVMCCNVTHYFKRAAKEPDFSVVFAPAIADSKKRKAIGAFRGDTKKRKGDTNHQKLLEHAPKMYCSTCDQMIDPQDRFAKEHLHFSCSGIPTTPLRAGYTSLQYARRMAGLGLRKSLFKSRSSVLDRKGIG